MPSDGLQGANAANSGRARSLGCRRIPGCGAFPSRRSVSNVSRFARNTPLHTKKFFLFYLRFFKPPYRGGKKKKIFFVLGVRGFLNFARGNVSRFRFPATRGDAVGRFTTATRRWAHAGKNAPTKRFPAFFVKGGCACVSEAWGCF